MAKVTGVRRATGRGRDEWFALLDRWGAVGRPYREIADWLTAKHGISCRSNAKGLRNRPSWFRTIA